MINNDYKVFTPEEISAQILIKLKHMAQDFLKQKISKAVITIPARFTDSQRQATLDAAKIAGLDCVRMIHEPTAAAMAYGLTNRKLKPDEVLNIIVYDYGGGTLDVSVVEISSNEDGENIFTVLGSAGNTHFGGADFDNRLCTFSINRFKKQYNISKLEDKYLLILLAGIKFVGSLRGFKKVTYDVKSPSPDYVVAVCHIEWIPNYETEGNAISFSAIGDASPYNTKSFSKNFLGPTAENRAFVRCVRNFLKINIVGQDEIGKPDKEQATEESNDSSPTSILSKIMKEKKIPFKKIKDKLVEEKFDKADSIESVEDIPKIKIFELIERIKSAKIKD